jgi:hypothetical protein
VAEDAGGGQLQWPAASFHCPCSITKEGGVLRHHGRRRRVAGGGDYQEWCGGRARDRWWGKLQIRAAPADMVDAVSTRSIRARACTQWAAGWRTGRSGWRLSPVAHWSGSDGGGSTCARDKRRRKWHHGASYSGEAGEGSRCSGARGANGAAVGEGSGAGGSGDKTLARRTIEK